MEKTFFQAKGKIKLLKSFVNSSNLLIIESISLVCISIWIFVRNDTLYIDEALLIIEVINRDFFHLHEPLGSDQVAPFLYLLSLKLLSLLFGYHEYVFRIISILSYCGFIFFNYKNLTILTKSIKVRLISLFLIGSNWMLVYYSGITKQYILDAFVFQLLLFLVLSEFYKRKPGLYLILAIVTLFISHVSIIVIACCSSVIFLEHFKDHKRPNFKSLLILIFPLIIFSAQFLLSIKDHPTKDYMLNFWSHAFMPRNVFSLEFAQFLYDQFSMIYSGLFHGPLFFSQIIKPILLVLSFVFTIQGCRLLIRQHSPKVLFLLISPIFIHLLLSGLRLYPFHSRFILYLLPSFYILVLLGASTFIRTYVAPGLFKFTFIPLIITFVTYYYAQNLFLPKCSEVKKALFYLENESSNSDLILHSNSAAAILSYYTNYNNISPKLNVSNLINVESNSLEIVSVESINTVWEIHTEVVLCDSVKMFDDYMAYCQDNKTAVFNFCTVCCYKVIK